MKKEAMFLLVIMCAWLMAGCGMTDSAKDKQTVEAEVLQENIVSVNLDDVVAQNDSEEQFRNHLEQVAEKEIIGEEGIMSADATVTYDEETGQYSIELLIETNGEVGGEQIELYKSALSKTYAKVALVVDGTVL